MKKLYLLFLIIYPISTYSQILIKGRILNPDGIGVISANIWEKGIRDITFSDNNGNFQLYVKNDSAIIKIKCQGYNTTFIKLDTVDKRDLVIKLTNVTESKVCELIGYAPEPRSFNIGYYGQYSDRPFGFFFNYKKNSFISKLSFSTDIKKDIYLSHDFGPFAMTPWSNKMYNFYIKSIYSKTDTISELHELLGYYFANRYVDIKIGYGCRINEFKHLKSEYLLGINKTFIFSLFGQYLKEATLSGDILLSKDKINYITFMYLELCNDNFRDVNLGIGYQNLDTHKDFAISLGLRYYITR